MNNGERRPSSNGGSTGSSGFDILTPGAAGGEVVPPAPAAAEVNVADEGGETDSTNQEAERNREAIAEKLRIINLYTLREAIFSMEKIGGDFVDFLGSRMVLEHTPDEDAECANWKTYDELIAQLKADYGDRTVVAPAGDTEGGNTGAGAGETGGAVVPPVVVGGEGGVTPSVATGENTGGDNGGQDTGENNPVAASGESRERRKTYGFFKRLGIGALVLASVLGVFGGGAQKDVAPQEIESSVGLEEGEQAIEEEKNFEILSMDDAYRDLFADAENDEYNPLKGGRYNFAPSLDTYREQVGEEAKDKDDVQLMAEYIGERTSQMVEALPFYIVDLPSVQNQVTPLREKRAKLGRDLTIAEINEILENDEAARETAIKEFRNWLEMAVAGGESEATTLHGTYWNGYMRNNRGEGQNFTHEDIEGVICQTNEDGSKAVILRNGDEYIIVKEGCTQPVRLEQLAGVPVIDPEDNTPPEDTPDTPPTDPPVTPPEKKLDPKNPEDEKLPEGHTWESEPLGSVTEESRIPDNYDPNEHTFVNNGERPGTSMGDVDESSQVQVGAVDTTVTESGDGSGRTIEQVINDADDSTTTDAGEHVSTQVNGNTVNEEINSAEQQAAQEAARQAQKDAEATRVEVIGEAAGGDGVVSQEENADMFNSGMYQGVKRSKNENK